MPADPEHAPRLLPDFADGAIVGVLPGGAGYLVQLPGSGPAAYVSRAAHDVRGWRPACSCGGWRASPWQRVDDPGAEDLGRRLVYAPDAAVANVPERADVRSALVAAWTHQHLGALRAVSDVEAAHRDVERALQALDEAVLAARRLAVSWELIGRAAGITRQSAHARWARRTEGGGRH